MNKKLFFNFLFCLIIAQIGRAQFPIYMPTSESSVMAMSPVIPGIDYESRLAINQLSQNHPLGDLHSLHVAYTTDIPKLSLLTGIQFAGDRLGTKNQNLMLRMNLAYELKLSYKMLMVVSFHFDFAEQSIDGQSYFNRFNYNDILFQSLSGTSNVKYLNHTFGMGIKHPSWFAGYHVGYKWPLIGEFNGENLFLRYNYSFICGLKLKTSVGQFRPHFSYTNSRSFANSLGPNSSKFPNISSLNFSLNYIRKKFTYGVGMRTIKQMPTMYHTQLGYTFKQVKATYSIGFSPYSNLNQERKVGVTSQATLEFILGRSKYYHRPVHSRAYEYFPSNEVKIERYFIDNVLVAYTEYDIEGNEILSKYFKNGVLNGGYSEAHPNGETKVYGFYSMGKMNGKWRYYDADGNCFKIEKYDMGNLIETEIIDVTY